MKAKTLIKSLFALCLFAVVFAQTAMAQTIVKHIVQRGETLETIAERYSTTRDDIIRLNPTAAQFIYVGMELKVQKQTSEQSIVQQPQETATDEENYERSTVLTTRPKTTYDEIEKPLIGFLAGYSINSYTGSDAKGLKSVGGYFFGITVRKHYSELFFVNVDLAATFNNGYKSNVTTSSGKYWNDDGNNYDASTNVELKTTNIVLPINVGLSFSNFYVKAGPYLSYAISGEMKTTGYETTYSDIHSSETGHVNNYTKIKDIDGFSRLNAGVEGSLGCKFNKFYIQASYRRGLTKMFEKQKVYEQNIYFTAGIYFN